MIHIWFRNDRSKINRPFNDLGTANRIVISLDVGKYLKELTDRFYRNESHAQLFDNVIQPPLFCLFLPDFYGPQWNNYTYSYFVQFMVFRCKSRYRQHRPKRTGIKIQPLYLDSFYWSKTFMYAPVRSLSFTILPPNLQCNILKWKI